MYKWILFITFAIAGCSLFEYHPYEVRVPENEQNLNAKAIGQIQSETAGKDTVTIILMGDTQRFYDEVEVFVRSANTQKADFVILAGDITDFGISDEFGWVHDIMTDLNKPYIAVIGNHDLSGNGEKTFRKMYGDLNTSFKLDRLKFILLNTNSREYRFNGKVPDIAWLQGQLAGDDFDRAIVVSHVPPFDGDFDAALEDQYVSALKQSGKVNLSLHAHQHTYRNGEFYNDGVRYVISTSMDNRMYLIIKLWDNEYEVKEVYY